MSLASSFLVVFVWILSITITSTQEPCTRTGGNTDPNIAGSVQESSILDFDPASPLYRTDTTIEGINGGTNINSGVTLTIARTAATPDAVNLNDLVELVTESVQSSTFGSRTFIRLKKAIDRDGTSFTASDDLDTIEFQISCTSLKNTGETKFFLMQLEIRDINDNPPLFVNAPYTASIDESAPVGTTVYSRISATDLDAGTNKEIEYAIVDGDGSINDGSTKFEFPKTSRGEIVVKSPLDFEAVQSYVLNISATDKASNVPDRKQTATTITINVRDVDDLGPKFVYSSCFEVNSVCFNPTYTTSVTSGSSSNTLVFTPVPVVPGNSSAVVEIIAQDRDTLNAPINFAIQQTLPAGYQNRFVVTTQQVSGSTNLYRALVSQVSATDRSEVRELELFIEARETLANRYSNRATIKMTIAAANNNNPQLSVPFQGFISENSPIGTIPRSNDGSNLLRVSVTDPDLISGETGTYTFSVSGTSLFRVNSDGYVQAAAIINYETNPVVTFNVTGTEVGTQSPRSGSVQVTVNVRDLNDNSPVFEAPIYFVNIEEGNYSAKHKILIEILATDKDNEISFDIQSVSNNGGGKFSLQPSSEKGKASISCTGNVDGGEHYVIILRASNQNVQNYTNSCRRRTSVPVEVRVVSL